MLSARAVNLLDVTVVDAFTLGHDDEARAKHKLMCRAWACVESGLKRTRH